MRQNNGLKFIFNISTSLVWVSLLVFQYFYIENPNASAAVTNIKVYDASISAVLPTQHFRGVMVMNNGTLNPELLKLGRILGRNLISWDAEMAHENISKVIFYFKSEFALKSYDGKNSDVSIAINVNRQMPIDPLRLNHNAAWLENERLFIFGHGNENFKAFPSAIEVVAHEFTHAVISHTSQLHYSGQSGALNEHFADVFGILIRHHFDTQYPNPFLVGDQLIQGPARARAQALRDMLEPSQSYTPQPKTMSEIREELNKDCVPTRSNDRCGVHELSGIPNSVVASIIQEMSSHSSEEWVWENIAHLIYQVMTSKLGPHSQFHDYQKALNEVCRSRVAPVGAAVMPLKFLPTESDCGIIESAFRRAGL